MKTYFESKICPSCSTRNEAKAQKCAHCGLHIPGYEQFANHLPCPFWKEIIFFLLGFLGLMIVVTIIQTILGVSLIAKENINNEADLAAVLTRPENLAFTEFLAYGIVFAAICLVLWKGWKDIIASFKGIKPYVAGALGFAAIFGIEFIYNLITRLILGAAGIPVSDNANQTTLIAIIGYSPVLSFFIFAIVGPFVEEVTYRIGLFGFLSRLGKIPGFILTALIFALMHFDFGTAFSGTNAGIIEWVQLPVYILSGFTFAFLYDRYGFAASFVAHFINNAFAILQIIAGSGS